MIYIVFALFIFVLLLNPSFRNFVAIWPDKEKSITAHNVIIFLLCFCVAALIKNDGQQIFTLEQLISTALIAGFSVVAYNFFYTLYIMYRYGKKDRRWYIHGWENICFLVSAVVSGFLIAFCSPIESLMVAGLSSFFFCLVR